MVIIGILVDRYIITSNDVGVFDLMGQLASKNGIMIGMRDIFNGFTGVSMYANDSLMISEICTYKKGKVEGVCLWNYWNDEGIHITNLDEYVDGRLHGVSLEYGNGKLWAVDYILNDFSVGNSISFYNDLSKHIRQHEALKLSDIEYEFIGVPSYIYKNEIRDRGFIFVSYGNNYIDSIRIRAFCSEYVIKDGHYICFAQGHRFGTVLLRSKSIKFNNDTLWVFGIDGFLFFKKIDLEFFAFCPPSAISCKACIWLRGNESDSVCYEYTANKRNILSSEFYYPFVFRQWIFSLSEVDTFTYITKVMVKDTIFTKSLGKHLDTTVVIIRYY